MAPETPTTQPRKPAGPRIIRPAGADGRNGPGGPLELNLEEMQDLGERLIREARERVAGLETRARELDAVVAGRLAELEREMAERRAAAERELAAWKEKHFGDAESAQKAGFERGFAEGQALGTAAGRDDGYQAGFQEGYSEGRQAGYQEAHKDERARIAAEAAPLALTLEGLVRQIEMRRKTVRREATAELLPLALEIAKKVVKREVRECPEVVVHNVRKAIDLAFRRTGLTVQVHPEDARLVERYAPEIFGCFAGLTGAVVTPAEDVGRGGCRVISGSGTVDLRIEAQLELIEQALFGRLAEDGPEDAEVLEAALPAPVEEARP
jgi:flagellar assembly protein FliH